MTPLVHLMTALAHVSGVTRRELRSQLRGFRDRGDTPDAWMRATPIDIMTRFVWSATQRDEFLQGLAAARYTLSEPIDKGLQVVTALEDHPFLDRLTATPWLFYRGDLRILDAPVLSFSGQRDAGTEALLVTARLTQSAAAQGFTVVSGGARGIDQQAHRAALASGGTTVVVLAQGIGTWSPTLAGENLDRRLLVLSEDLPWEAWSTESAMRRNRVIVDLADVFVVPQSGLTGGAHSTAQYALRQNVVTWVPDLGDAYMGNKALLQQGARVLSPEAMAHVSELRGLSRRIDLPDQARLF